MPQTFGAARQHGAIGFTVLSAAAARASTGPVAAFPSNLAFAPQQTFYQDTPIQGRVLYVNDGSTEGEFPPYLLLTLESQNYCNPNAQSPLWQSYQPEWRLWGNKQYGSVFVAEQGNYEPEINNAIVNGVAQLAFPSRDWDYYLCTDGSRFLYGSIAPGSGGRTLLSDDMAVGQTIRLYSSPTGLVFDRPAWHRMTMGFWAYVTYVSGWEYSWVEQLYDFVSDTWSNGRSGNYAVESSGVTIVPNDVRVWLQPVQQSLYSYTVEPRFIFTYHFEDCSGE